MCPECPLLAVCSGRLQAPVRRCWSLFAHAPPRAGPRPRVAWRTALAGKEGGAWTCEARPPLRSGQHFLAVSDSPRAEEDTHMSRPYVAENERESDVLARGGQRPAGVWMGRIPS